MTVKKPSFPSTVRKYPSQADKPHRKKEHSTKRRSPGMPANENLKEIKDQIKAKYLENKFRKERLKKAKAAVRGSEAEKMFEI